VKSGTMSDKDNEGHPGWVIDQISGAANTVANAGIKPNVVLLHAGTNDCGTYGWEDAHTRLGKLIDVVVAKWPEAAVIVAKIIPSTNANTLANIKSFNSKVQGMWISELVIISVSAKANLIVQASSTPVLMLARGSVSWIWARLSTRRQISAMLFTRMIRGSRRWLLFGSPG
jgi:hypothetical protein